MKVVFSNRERKLPGWKKKVKAANGNAVFVVINSHPDIDVWIDCNYEMEKDVKKDMHLPWNISDPVPEDPDIVLYPVWPIGLNGLIYLIIPINENIEDIGSQILLAASKKPAIN